MCVRQLGSTTIDPTTLTIKPTNVNEVKTQENNNVPSTEVKPESDKPASTEIARITQDNSSKVGIEKTVSSTSEANVVSFNPNKARAVEKPLNVNAFTTEDEIGFQSVRIDDKEIKDTSSNEFKVEYDKSSKPEEALKKALDKATDAAKSHDGIEAIVANYSKDGKIESYSLYKATQADVDKVSKLSDEGKYDGKVARFVTPSSILFISYEKNTDIKSSYVPKQQQENIPSPISQPTLQDPVLKNEVVFQNGKAEVVSASPSPILNQPNLESEIVITIPNKPSIPSYLLNPNQYSLDPNLAKIEGVKPSFGFDFNKPLSPTNPPLVLSSELLSQPNSYGPWLPSYNLDDPFAFSLFTPFSPSLLSSTPSLLGNVNSNSNTEPTVSEPKQEPSKIDLKELTINSDAAKKHIENIEKSVNKNFSDLSGTYVNDSKQLFAKSMEKYTDPKYDSLIKDETLKAAVSKLRTGQPFSNEEIEGVAKAVKSLPMDKLSTEQLQAVKDFESSFSDFEGKMEILKQSSTALEGQLKEQAAIFNEMSTLVQGVPDNSPAKQVFSTFLNKATLASQRIPPNSFEILTNNAIARNAMDIISGKNTINAAQATKLQSSVVSFMEQRLASVPENQKAELSQQIEAIKKIDPNNIVDNKDIRLSLYLVSTAEFEMNVHNVAKENGPDSNKQVAALTRNFFGASINNAVLNSIVRAADTGVEASTSSQEEHTASVSALSASLVSHTEEASADFSALSAHSPAPAATSMVDTTNSQATLGAQVISIAGTATALAINAKQNGEDSNASQQQIQLASSLVRNNVDKINDFNFKIAGTQINPSTSSLGNITNNFSSSKINAPTLDFSSSFDKYLSTPYNKDSESSFCETLSANSKFNILNSKINYNSYKTEKCVDNFSNAMTAYTVAFKNTDMNARNISLMSLGMSYSFIKSQSEETTLSDSTDEVLASEASSTIENADKMEAALAIIDSQFADLAGTASISNLLKRFRDIISELDMNISKSRKDTSTRVGIDVSNSRRIEEFKRHLKALDRSRAENNKDFRNSKQVIEAMVPKLQDPKDKLAMSSLVDALSSLYAPKASSIY
jgi:hypothetical protein